MTNTADRWPVTMEYLEGLVQERTQETARLEFKRELPPSSKNDDIAKDIASFANADGGTIIYGIAEDGSAASEIIPMLFKGIRERLVQVARTSLDEPLNVDAWEIPSRESPESGVVVVNVPQSHRRPHVFGGSVWGRTATGNTTLTRRQVGELFARSDGFASEFGLALPKRGRIAFRTDRTYEPSSGTSTGVRHFIVLENDGETVVYGGEWAWVAKTGAALPIPQDDDPFPVEVLHPGARVVLRVLIPTGVASPLRVQTRWRDYSGREGQAVWPVSFSS